MKKLLLTALLAFSSTFALVASHVVGGELKLWTDTINGQFAIKIELRIVRDIYGIPMGPVNDVAIQDSSLNTITTVPLSLQAGTGVNNFIYPPTGVNLIPQFELYVYEGHFFPTNPNIYLRAVYEICCRHNAVDNIINSASESYHIYADIDLTKGLNSELPVITPMAAYVNINTPFSISHFTQDADGDSLYFSLKTPLSHNGDTVANYSLPWQSATNPIPFQVDANIGFISGYADNISIMAYRIEIEEYRKNTSNQYALLARHNKDLIIQSVAGNSASNFSLGNIPNSTTLPNGAIEVPFLGGQNNQFTLSFSNVSTQNLTVKLFGGPFDFDSINTNTTKDSISNTECDFHISWNPNQLYARNEPYYFVVRVMHHGFPYDLLMAISVKSSIGNKELSFTTALIYPNPSSDYLVIETAQPWQKVAFFGISGAPVLVVDQYQERIDISAIPAGVYMVNVYQNNFFETFRFIKY